MALFIGDNGDNTIVGTDRRDFILARRGNDTIDAGNGDNIVIAGRGNDVVIAGSGDDFVLAGKGDDEVSLGGGNNRAFLGSGNDRVNFVWSENVSSSSAYHGQRGHDTFHLILTDDEVIDPAIIADLEAFEAHIASGSHRSFQFQSIDLRLSGFEEIEISAPVFAADDVAAADEDGIAITIDVLANDRDFLAANNSALMVTAFDDSGIPAGASLVLNPDNTFTFDPGTASQDLAEGQQFEVAFTYTIADDQGFEDEATAIITITGSNDAPVISSETQTGAVTEAVDGSPLENATTHISTGVITFTDVDLTDTHTASHVDRSTGYFGNFSLDPVDQDANSVGWSFSVSDADIDYLGAGETLTQFYDVTVDDGHGGNALQAVEVIIAGLNDGPTATSDTNAGDAVIEAGDLGEGDNTASGMVLLNDSDPDLNDTLRVSEVNGTTVVTSLEVIGVYGALSINSDGEWTYLLDNDDADTNALSDGQTATEVFSYAVEDLAGATSSSTLTINIAGADDSEQSTIDVTDLDGNTGFVIDGTERGNLGWAVNELGDVNNDGFDDFALGTAGESLAATYILYGGADIGSTGTIFPGAFDGSDGSVLTFSGTNSSVPSGGDFNGDGIKDVVIGSVAPYYLDDAGTAAAFYGQTGGFGAEVKLFDIPNGTHFSSPDLYGYEGKRLQDYFGWDVSSGGDVNGDGFDDLIVGAPLYEDPDSPIFSGAAFVWFGSDVLAEENLRAEDLDGTNGFLLIGESEDERSGYSVDLAGDFQGDGYSDMLIGSPNSGTGGKVYLVDGSQDVGESGQITLETFQQGAVTEYSAVGSEDFLGRSVSYLGDVNGDGFDDIIMGAPGAGDGGEAYVVYGGAFKSDLTPSTMTSDDGFKITGPEGTTLFGTSLSGAGDVNGDGIADIIIGSIESSAANDAYVIFGVEGTRLALNVSELDGSNGFVVSGSASRTGSIGDSVSSAGDVNGDGFDDIVIGAAGDQSVNPYSDAYVIFGRDFGGTVDWIGTTDDDLFTGGETDEILIGGLGNDIIQGGAGEDVLKGANGNDTLAGGGDSDLYFGGNGGDTFVIEATDGFQFDRIVDFEQGADTIQISGFGDLDFDVLDSNGDDLLTVADDAVLSVPAIFGASLTLKLDQLVEVVSINGISELTPDDLAFV